MNIITQNIHKLATLGAFFLLWVLLAHNQLVKPIFLPSITEVIHSLQELFFSLEGIKDTLFSLKRVCIGFLIALIIAVPLGISLGIFKKVYESVEWFIDFFRSVPVSALFPLFLIFFGFGDASKIAMGAWGAGFVVLINTIHGVWSAKENRRVMALTKQATKFQVLTKITFFETLPFIFAGIRIGISWNLIVVIIAEMFIGTRYGLGHQIYNASVILDTPGVIAGIIAIGLLGYILNRLVIKLEKRVVHW